MNLESKMKNHFQISVLAMAMGILLSVSGCSTTVKSRVEADYADANKVVQGRLEQDRIATMQSEARRVAAQEVAHPYVAGKSIPLSREVLMPEPLRVSMPVTAFFANTPVGLAIALQQISTATNLSISATADALMSAGAFAPKTGVAVAPILPPPMVTLRASGTPLWKLLDDIAAQVQAAWRPTPNGAVFYRVETKSYDLMTVPQIAATQASLGRTGSASNAFNSEAKTSFEMKPSNQMDGIKSLVEGMLSTGGKLSLSTENQILLVTDTPQVQARIEEFIKHQNKVMSRRVRMLVEAIEVVSKDGSEFGIDWNLVYNTTSKALSASAPASLSTALSGSVNLQQMLGPLSGSGAVIKALNEIGTVVNRRVFPFITTSGRPITQALRTTFNYVDQVQTTAIASSANMVTQAPTVTQKDETVGTFLTLVPNAKSDGTVFISVSFDVTSADPLRPYTVGSGDSAVTVQQKTINGSGVIQEVPVHGGRTEVIGGLELLTNQNSTRTLGQYLPVFTGGSQTSASTKTVTVLLVTATVEEGI